MALVTNNLLLVALFVLLPTYVFNASITHICPISGRHCHCVFSGPFYSIKCAGLNATANLELVVKNATQHAVILEMRSVKLRDLPSRLFDNSSIHTLLIGNSTVDGPMNLEGDLHHLLLENVKLSKNFTWKHLSGLRMLQVLFVHNSTIPDIVPGNFSRVVSSELQSFTVTHSKLTTVEENSLKNMKSLRYLRISHSSLKTFPAEALPKMSKLEQLRLDYNNIHSLPNGVFSNLPNLKLVSLSNNSLSTLSEQVFNSIWNPRIHLDLRDNPIKCDCRILWTIRFGTKPRSIIAKCASPKRLFGRNVITLKPKDLKC